MIDFLERLVKTPCVPQFQNRMENLLRKEIDFAEIETDELGNIHLKSEASGGGNVSFLAHLSEIGFLIEHIDDSGFIRFNEITTVDKRTLLGQRMMIHGKDGDVRGVVGAKPPHLQQKDEEKKSVEIEKMFIDVGADTREDAEDMGISIGDSITLEGLFKELPDGRIIGKAMDDRAGCLVAIEALKRIVSNGAESSVWLLSQETSFPKDLNSDYAIAVDATLAGPYPPERVKIEPYELPVSLGEGPALTLREKNSNTREDVKNLMNESAERAGVNLQIEASSRAGVDLINPLKQKVAGAILSLPVKYIRTPGEVLSASDLEASIRVLEEFVEVVS